VNKVVSDDKKGLLVIPSYKESDRLPQFLVKLQTLGVLGRQGWTVRIVDDGSGVEEVERLENALLGRDLRFDQRLELVQLPKNQGKGGAVYSGWKDHRKFSLLGFVDADGAVPANEVMRVLELAENSPDTAFFASRVKMRGRTVCRSSMRHLSGRLFASFVGMFIDEETYDSQCGLKIIPANVFEMIEPWLNERGFAFDVELLAALLEVKCPVVEVPIDWVDVAGSKVRLLRDSFRMFFAVRTIANRRKSWRNVSE